MEERRGEEAALPLHPEERPGLRVRRLWDLWVGEKQKLVTRCLVTTTPNELVRPVHNRMPCIVPPASYGEWLDPDTPAERRTALLRPYPAEEMQVAEVGPAVNSPRNDGPECLEAA